MPLRAVQRQHKGRSLIFNSVLGVQFTSSAFKSVREAQEVQISLNGKGCWIDNPLERFWRSLKYEEMHLHALRQSAAGQERHRALRSVQQRRPEAPVQLRADRDKFKPPSATSAKLVRDPGTVELAVAPVPIELHWHSSVPEAPGMTRARVHLILQTYSDLTTPGGMVAAYPVDAASVHGMVPCGTRRHPSSKTNSKARLPAIDG